MLFYHGLVSLKPVAPEIAFPPFFPPLIIKAFPIHFQIKVRRIVKDVVSPRSARNLRDKAISPHPPSMSEEGEEAGWWWLCVCGGGGLQMLTEGLTLIILDADFTPEKRVIGRIAHLPLDQSPPSSLLKPSIFGGL